MPVFINVLSMNLKIFNFLSSEVGLSVTTTNEGLLEDARIKPQEPSSKENLTPLTVKFLLFLDYLFLFFGLLFF